MKAFIPDFFLTSKLILKGLGSDSMHVKDVVLGDWRSVLYFFFSLLFPSRISEYLPEAGFFTPSWSRSVVDV